MLMHLLLIYIQFVSLSSIADVNDDNTAATVVCNSLHLTKHDQYMT